MPNPTHVLFVFIRNRYNIALCTTRITNRIRTFGARARLPITARLVPQLCGIIGGRFRQNSKNVRFTFSSSWIVYQHVYGSPRGGLRKLLSFLCISFDLSYILFFFYSSAFRKSHDVVLCIHNDSRYKPVSFTAFITNEENKLNNTCD